MASLHELRRDYTGKPLPKQPSTIDPWDFFATWLREAIDTGEPEPTAMTLATVGADGRPESRIVLLKEFSPEGLVFFTNYESAKGRAINAHPVASASFWWPQGMRQVRAVGPVRRLSRRRSEAYFAKRPHSSQIEAWASRQSEPIRSRRVLREVVSATEGRFGGETIPCPPFWGGYLIDVDTFEFWQGLSGRLHDRISCHRVPQGWSNQRLQP